MDKRALLEVLADWSPWGKELDAGRERPAYTGRVLDLLRTNVVVAITGPRRSGKSYVMRQASRALAAGPAGPKGVLVVNLEDRRLDAPSVALLDEAFDAYLELVRPEGTPVVFLDEVQAVAGWERWVRGMHELGRARVVVSGSSSRLLSGELATLLTGRHLDVVVYPLGFAEFLAFKGAGGLDAAGLAARRAEVRARLDEYLRHGGFPEVVLGGHAQELLLTYLDDVLTRDVERRHKVRRVETLGALARFYLTNVANPVNFSTVARHLGTTTVTVERFTSHLEEAGLVFLVGRHSFKVREQERAARKVYAIDTGLANAAGFRFSPDAGRVAENAVAVELRRRCASCPGRRLFHWRGERGEEVDFVVTEGGAVQSLVQVCWDIGAYRARERETRALLRAGARLGCDDLVVVTGDAGGEERVGERTVRFVPLATWLLGGGEPAGEKG